MAIKELKSIKFPGLEDTYIIPENNVELDDTLSIEGMAADAKAVGDKFDNITKQIEDAGSIDIDFDISNEGKPNPINADTLGGYAASEYMRKSQGLVEVNYSVVDGLNEPENPKENMIWIQTEDMNGYVLSKHEPNNPSDGFVWVSLGSDSNVSLHTFKIGEVEVNEVFPLYAKQYLSGAWEDKIAKSHQNGNWIDLWNGYLYFSEKEYIDITGGWIGEALAYSSGYPTKGDPNVTKTKDYIHVQSSGQNLGGILRTKNKVNVNGFKKITADIFASSSSYCSICFWTEIGTYHTDNLAQEIMITNTERQTIESALTLPDGEYYVGLTVLDKRSIAMYSMKLS